MSNDTPISMDDDDLEDFTTRETPEEKQAREDAFSGKLRSTADEILDVVEGGGAHHHRRGSECPLCGGPTKKRGPTVMAGVATRRCLKCRQEFPTGMVASRVQPVALPPVIPIPGPYLGEGGGPISPEQPVHRQISEHIRRIRDREP